MNEQRQKVSFSISHQTALLAGLQLLWRYLTVLYAHAACFGSRLKSDCQQHWAGAEALRACSSCTRMLSYQHVVAMRWSFGTSFGHLIIVMRFLHGTWHETIVALCAGFFNSTVDPGQAAPGPGYGYKGKFDLILKTEFPHLKSKVYADHAGATLYSKSQIDGFQQVELLCKSLFCTFTSKHITADASFTAMHMPVASAGIMTH